MKIIADLQIQKIAGTVRARHGGTDADKYEDIAGFCKAVKKEEIVKNGYVFTPGMKQLSGELRGYFKEGRVLEKTIQENLAKLRI